MLTCRTNCVIGWFLSFAVLTFGVELVIKPPNTVRKSGESFVFTCEFDGVVGENSTQPEWKYKRDNVTTFRLEIPNDIHVKTQNITHKTRLFFTNITIFNKGFYVCSANVGDRTLESAIYVDVYEPIVVTNAPDVQNPVQGTQSSLKCLAKSDPKPIVEWWRNNNKIEKSDRYGFEKDGQILLINDFDVAKDNGVYQCHISIDKYGDTKIVDIVVHGFVPPEVEPYTKYSRVKENGTIDLICNVTGVPVPDVTWFIDDFSLSKIDGKYSFSHDYEKHAVLTITNASADDTGTYKCDAKNDVGTASALLMLKVIAKPKIKPLENEIVVLKGNATQVFCDYDDYDENVNGSGAVWMSKRLGSVSSKPGRIYSVSQKYAIVLNINNATMEDATIYTCYVTNIAGGSAEEFELKVEQSPVVKRNTPARIRAYETTVKLGCTVEAVPDAKWTWKNASGYQLDSVLSQNNRTTTLELSLSPSDSPGLYGKYSCIAENKHGMHKADFEIVKIEKPKDPFVDIRGVHPNRVEVFVGNYTTGSASQPNEIYIKHVFSQTKNTDTSFSWDAHDQNRTPFNYDPKTNIYVVKKLIPKATYDLAVRTKNEAGFSNWISPISGTYETLDAQVPLKPTFVTKNNTKCGAYCRVEWKVLDDRGEPVTKYFLQYSAIGDGKESMHWKNITVKETHTNLANLIAGQRYEARVKAKNAVGLSNESDALILSVESDVAESIIPGVNSLHPGVIVAIVLVILLLLLLLVDVACFFTNRCGLLMCVCVNCCHKTPPEVKAKIVAMEEAKVDEKKQPIRDVVEHNDVRDEPTETTPMIDSANGQTKKDTTV